MIWQQEKRLAILLRADDSYKASFPVQLSCQLGVSSCCKKGNRLSKQEPSQSVQGAKKERPTTKILAVLPPSETARLLEKKTETQCISGKQEEHLRAVLAVLFCFRAGTNFEEDF